MNKAQRIISDCHYTLLETLPNWKQVIKLAKLNNDGMGNIKLTELPEHLISKNGKTWARQAEKYFNIETIREGNKVIEWKFLGIKQENNNIPSIPKNIRDELSGGFCAILATNANLDIDHKYDFNYEFYNNDKIRADKNSYQLLNRAANAKKREESIKRKNCGYKFDNRLVGCTFSTALYSLKDTPDLFTVERPYDGSYFTDPHKTLQIDRQFYLNYYAKFVSILGEEKMIINYYENIIIPTINNIIKDHNYINDVDAVISLAIKHLI